MKRKNNINKKLNFDTKKIEIVIIMMIGIVCLLIAITCLYESLIKV